jgi:hypothetical protein
MAGHPAIFDNNAFLIAVVLNTGKKLLQKLEPPFEKVPTGYKGGFIWRISPNPSVSKKGA